MEKGWKTPARRALLEHTASQYQSASASQRKQIVAHFVTATGYVRKYAVWVLNHAKEILQTASTPRSRYDPEVQQALELAWETLNRICAKRLVPFLSDIIASLEHGGHLRLSEEHRRTLLSMSATTVDRLLQAPRRKVIRSLSTTKAGPLLKQQIPIRTFAEWDEAQPGFLEIDLVAHCGPCLEGSFLYTLTMTDVGTGWTECLPLLHRAPEAVVAALQHAHTLFPFPLLGIDVDNGDEFINETVATYCAREQITFTRGRPHEKRDQCFVEQKNGVVVRQVVGRDRYESEQAARQLGELYGALRLYVNCFQPSMKLLAKEYEGRKVRRVYDPAKTPWQRLRHSDVLSHSQQQKLQKMVNMLDPLRLFQQIRRLQQAVFRCAVGHGLRIPSAPVVVFAIEGCLMRSFPSPGPEVETVTFSSVSSSQEPAESRHVLTWRRTSKDPFADQWEHILLLVQANPSRSSGSIFRELQALFPGRYQPLQIRTLQRGVRKIRAHLLQIQEHPWPQDVLQGQEPPLAPRQTPEPAAPIPPAASSPPHTQAADAPPSTATVCTHALKPPQRSSSRKRRGHRAFPPSTGGGKTLVQDADGEITIEQALTGYLERYRGAQYQETTQQWHQAALGQFQQYLLSERHLRLACEITGADVHGWFAFLHHTPGTFGKTRATLSIEMYVHSALAFCLWLFEQGVLASFQVSEDAFPRTRSPLPFLIEPALFEQFVQESQLGATNEPQAHPMLARDQALLWVLFDTGISVSEVCALRRQDVDLEAGTLRVQGQEKKERRLVLGPGGLHALRVFLKQAHTAHSPCASEEGANGALLFCTEHGRALTPNTLTLLFQRLRKRAGMREIAITPSLLRHSFALRYLQAGGDPRGLQELLGYKSIAQVRQYLRWHEQLLHCQTQKEAEET